MHHASSEQWRGGTRITHTDRVSCIHSKQFTAGTKHSNSMARHQIRQPASRRCERVVTSPHITKNITPIVSQGTDPVGRRLCHGNVTDKLRCIAARYGSLQSHTPRDCAAHLARGANRVGCQYGTGADTNTELWQSAGLCRTETTGAPRQPGSPQGPSPSPSRAPPGRDAALRATPPTLGTCT